MNIDWNQLKSFEAVARIGSLAAVSRKTGATQPTLSRHVRELEENLSVQLFDRTVNGLIRREGIKIDRHFFRFRSDDENDCWQMVVNGFGIGFTFVALGGAEPQVERLIPTVATGRVPIWLTAHAELRTSRRIRHVYDFLSAQISAKLYEARLSN